MSERLEKKDPRIRIVGHAKDFAQKLEKRQKKSERMIKNEKKPYDLIDSFESRVKIITPYEYTISVRNKDHSNFIGHREPSYHTSIEKGLEIVLEDNAVGVKNLFFHGQFPGVRGGDDIRAYVVKGKLKELPVTINVTPPYITCFHSPLKFQSHVLAKGGFTEKMIALQIDILGNSGEILRTDTANNYSPKSKFVGKPYLFQEDKS